MRETVLMKGESATLVIVTTRSGTEVLDEEEEVVETHPEDRHEAILAKYLAQGWEIEEYLRAYGGEGIQHVALGTTDIFASVEGMRAGGVRFLDTPDTYYELLSKRMPDLTADEVARLSKNRILTDGAPTPEGGRLLQIFTGTVIGPIFFELIQRKGDQGFGEGNFRALFESIELDQIRRGVLVPSA